MPSTPATLSPEEIKHFHHDGYVIVRSAFSRDDALATQHEWWSELAEAHGILQADRSTWHPIPSDLKRAKHSPIQERILTERVRGVIDDLLGPGTWPPPRDWGRTIATFPQPGEWDVPTAFWHFDSPYAWHRDTLNGLFVVSFMGSVGKHSGGTLILSGSPRLLEQQEGRLTPLGQSGMLARIELFHRSHPWLMALTGKAPSPANRIAAFMDGEVVIEGVPLRVVELTGEPGDMVFCHPAIVHCGSPNHGSQPRFMRIKQQLMTHEGRRLLRAAQ